MEHNNTIFGLRAIIEALQSGAQIEKLYIQKGLSGTLASDLMKLIKKEQIPMSHVPIEKLDYLTKKGNHQGVVAVTSLIKYADLEELIAQLETTDKKPLFLLLDQITDVRNFGAIIRTAECTGVDAIITQKQGSAPLNADAIKTSAGAAFKVPICRVDHIKDAIFQLQAADITIVAATEKTTETIYDVNFNKAIAIVMGSEDRGVNPSVLKLVNHKVKLPLLGTIESLNVSVACGAFLYEVVRQRSLNV
ncbi:MAG: 23S rRNA (guanosine(2251)-2'-O)-methyltransferase RlmB [Flavobacteriaceae bacterium]|nr:23S rRNA (guanosine(2251)-2'-O)-methyltransferase RlmB [Flavobacteriaceae bacterium]